MSARAFQLRNAKTIGSTPLADGDAKWIGLRAIQWTDPSGKERKWECADRKTRKGDVDGMSALDTAVAVLTIIQRPESEPHALLVSQFRPPVNGVILELPAGLVDAGEGGDEGTKRAALRELEEETGYGTNSQGGAVEVKLLSNVMYNDPGLTGANMKLCTVEIQLPKDAPEPVAVPDEGEFIERHLVPLRSLHDELQSMSPAYAEFQKNGYAVDARLAHLATGIQLGQAYVLK